MLSDITIETFVEFDRLRVDIELRRDECDGRILKARITTLGQRVIDARPKSLKNPAGLQSDAT